MSHPERPVRVVVAGMGDTGLITAVNLSRHRRLVDVVGISSKPGLFSGKDLGWRLARPEQWAAKYHVPFGRYRALDGVRLVHGTMTGLDPDGRLVTVESADGATTQEPYDVLVLATGVRSGFWRRPELQGQAQLDQGLRDMHDRFAAAGSIAIVGGGATAVNSAAQLAEAFPATRVDLYFPGDNALTRHHPRVWGVVRARLQRLGVRLHPGHRAVLPADLSPSPGPVAFTTGRPSAEAELVLWAVGRAEPNTAWLPDQLLDQDGFVRVRADLRTPGHDDIWAVGDVAASDPLRASARNLGAELVARNIVATVRGRSGRDLRIPAYAQGSVLGPLHDGLEIFFASGRRVRLPRRPYFAIEHHLTGPLMYRGIRPAPVRS
ncbi:NAD(P)/FAD-dependent oxidoreductase [Catenuloplanes japonicus]|uniref:NAD(P)/FAD-dependent oxidoreductase n=1 Tax=Catenuloplanes japonicus TaxID=33876 RepID=UPI0005260E9F|nr:FAD-dependent oxidoreductase [Catenuloplanes japonicus]